MKGTPRPGPTNHIKPVMFTNGIVELITWFSEHLSGLGSIASILGLVITVFVFFKIRRLYARLLFIARVPEHIKQLQAYRSRITKQLQNFDESLEETRIELAECEATLKSLKYKLRGDMRKSVVELTKLIANQRYSLTRHSKHEVHKIYAELAMVIQSLRELQTDERWRD